MRIMCLNGWGGKLYDALLPYLSQDPPDVLCLQEVVHSPATNKDWLTYRDGAHVLPQRANFFADVCEALPEHIAIFCPAAQGELWDDDTPIASQWGLASFVHKSIPIIAQVQGFVHKGFEPAGYGAHPRSRSAHAMRLFDYSANRALSVTHMHGLRDLAGKMDTPERRAQAHKLLALSDHVTETGDLRIICGDFNVQADSDTLDILRAAGMQELVTTGNFPGTRSSHYRKPGRFADYLLVNRTADIRGFQVVYNPEVSDHCPLVLDI